MSKDTRIDLLEGTLKDTESILFDAVVEMGLKQLLRTKKAVAHKCQDILNKRAKLIAARRKRPGKLS